MWFSLKKKLRRCTNGEIYIIKEAIDHWCPVVVGKYDYIYATIAQVRLCVNRNQLHYIIFWMVYVLEKIRFPVRPCYIMFSWKCVIIIWAIEN